MRAEIPIKCYTPDKSAYKLCESIIHRYLPPILSRFHNFLNEKIDLSRDEIHRSLLTTMELLECVNFLLIQSNEKPLEIQPTAMPMRAFDITLGFEKYIIKMPNGEDVRLAIIDCITKLQCKMLRDMENDTKSLEVMAMIWISVVVRQRNRTPFQSQLNVYNRSHFRNIRSVFAKRINIQQNCRDELLMPKFAQSHLIVLRNLLELSTSRYAVVRCEAQLYLFQILRLFPFAHRYILDDIVRMLTVVANEHCFKGILYVLYGRGNTSLVIKQDWLVVQKIWLILLRTKLPEKPSIVQLLNKVSDKIYNKSLTIDISLNIPDQCVDRAILMLSARPKMLSKTIIVDSTLTDAVFATEICENDIQTGLRRERQRNDANQTIYLDILREIDTILRNNSLNCHYKLMASRMIYCLMDLKIKCSVEIIQHVLHNLISESIEQRNIAMYTMRLILKQQKRERVKIQIDPFAMGGVPNPKSRFQLKPGYRLDNQWLQYDCENLPKSQSQWDEPKYVHEITGFFAWPSNCMIYAPSAQQPKLNRMRNELSLSEHIIHDFFANQTNIGKMIAFWSLEADNGNEHFSRTRLILIEQLCDIFGDVLLDPILEHLQSLIKVKNSESSHRCAAEIMAGIMRGMKHWNFTMTDNLYAKLKPLIRLALDNVTDETNTFWSYCFLCATHKFDPRRQYWLYEVVMEHPLRESSSSMNCSRIICIQSLFEINQHCWRMNSIFHHLLEYIRPFLNHNFQNVRQQLSGLLSNIFKTDLKFANASEPQCPRVKDFISEVVQKMHAHCTENEESSNESKKLLYDQTIRLFKTTCQWIILELEYKTNGNIVEYFELLPFACRFERSKNDLELAEMCSSFLAMLSQGLTLANCMDAALAKIEEISYLSSWSIRLTSASILQVFVFNNMPTVVSRSLWVEQVQSIVLRLMEDSNVEVRIKAAEVLVGLVHCSVLPSIDALLKLFQQKCCTKVATRHCCSASNDSSYEAERARSRHMGVLGLCALISSHPYDIPEFVPHVFKHLTKHFNDPQPISSVIRKTIADFKQTHYDNWTMYQDKFTVEQLDIFNDFTLLPTNYA